MRKHRIIILKNTNKSAPRQELFLIKPQRDRIHAIPESRWLWAIIEDVTEMATTSGAEHFGSAHAEGNIRFLGDTSLFDRRPKAWPACAGLEFGIRTE